MAQPDWFRPVASEGVTVLIVDDDLVFLQTLKISLEKASYQVALASRGWDALDIVAQQPIDLVLLDLMLPDLDGFQVCERLREVSSVPIIIITARSQEQDMLHGLNAGADDYLVKPFSHKELLARVRAVLRRMHYPEVDDRQPVLQFGDLSLDFRRHEVLLRGDAVELTALEYRLLRHLACNAGRVFTHAQLLDAVWGPEYANETHYLWVCVSRLRRKLGDDASHPNYILTEAGTGYRFCRA